MQFLPMAGKVSGKKEGVFSPGSAQIVELSDFADSQPTDEVCCGGPTPPESNPFEQPGYELQHYVRAFLRIKGRQIPLVETTLNRKDRVGTVMARFGTGRDGYTVVPGLYGAGFPDGNSPVIITANYKLTFDLVRKELDSLSCWILVLDTRGINVWCAAGKNSFSTAEIIRQVEATALASLLNHRILILPQLGAPGVAAHEVKLKCGFRVIYGPIRISDLRNFLENDMVASREMRGVTFTVHERFELIPVELFLFGKKIWWVFVVTLILSGIGPSIFSFTQAGLRGVLGSVGIIWGTILGAVITPLLLPWIPSRRFFIKGGLVGIFGGLLLIWGVSGFVNKADQVGLFFIIAVISSYLAMNFTGSTPYTSPSGVENEMKIAIPMQLCFVVLGVVIWLLAPFL